MIFGDISVVELWSIRLNPSDLYNIERGHNPLGGGGQRYIQIGQPMVQPSLEFLKVGFADLPVHLPVRCIGQPEGVDEVLFHRKSEGRMRIANQNRYAQHRCRAWSPANGFPSLQPHENTRDARTLLAGIGGLHVFLVRDGDGEIWAGYTTGSHTPADLKGFGFGPLLYEGLGGYWQYKGTTP